ncbi:hypothetical protein BB561_005084 [Smittium simulii]|uniref:Actin interacting protein 3 C-terminal domain-containing protein n=1 Tax=Smittium simulii TaxID=133385 RepID=A0A2T9YCH1_9FUNG|nr:hypothetical protein BB561_005084 [Smittium simulii]
MLLQSKAIGKDNRDTIEIVNPTTPTKPTESSAGGESNLENNQQYFSYNSNQLSDKMFSSKINSEKIAFAARSEIDYRRIRNKSTKNSDFQQVKILHQLHEMDLSNLPLKKQPPKADSLFSEQSQHAYTPVSNSFNEPHLRADGNFEPKTPAFSDFELKHQNLSYTDIKNPSELNKNTFASYRNTNAPHKVLEFTSPPHNEYSEHNDFTFYPSRLDSINKKDIIKNEAFLHNRVAMDNINRLNHRGLSEGGVNFKALAASPNPASLRRPSKSKISSEGGIAFRAMTASPNPASLRRPSNSKIISEAQNPENQQLGDFFPTNDQDFYKFYSSQNSLNFKHINSNKNFAVFKDPSSFDVKTKHRNKPVSISKSRSNSPVDARMTNFVVDRNITQTPNIESSQDSVEKFDPTKSKILLSRLRKVNVPPSSKNKFSSKLHSKIDHKSIISDSSHTPSFSPDQLESVTISPSFPQSQHNDVGEAYLVTKSFERDRSKSSLEVYNTKNSFSSDQNKHTDAIISQLEHRPNLNDTISEKLSSPIKIIQQKKSESQLAPKQNSEIKTISDTLAKTTADCQPIRPITPKEKKNYIDSDVKSSLDQENESISTESFKSLSDLSAKPSDTKMVIDDCAENGYKISAKINDRNTLQAKVGSENSKSYSENLEKITNLEVMLNDKENLLKFQTKKSEQILNTNADLLAQISELEINYEKLTQENLKIKTEQLTQGFSKNSDDSAKESEYLKYTTSKNFKTKIEFFLEKEKAKSRFNSLGSKMDDLEILVNELRKDVVFRKSTPANTLITKAHSEVDSVKKDCEALREFLTNATPKWKSAWATDLQVILAEQQFSKNLDTELEDLYNDVKSLGDIMEKIDTVLKLKQSKATEDKSKVELRAPILRTVFLDDLDEEEHKDIKEGIFNQILTIDVDSKNRLEAIEMNQRFRKIDLESRKNDFEIELASKVQTKKKHIANKVDELEKTLEVKQEEVMQQMFISMAK